MTNRLDISLNGAISCYDSLPKVSGNEVFCSNSADFLRRNLCLKISCPSRVLRQLRRREQTSRRRADSAFRRQRWRERQARQRSATLKILPAGVEIFCGDAAGAVDGPTRGRGEARSDKPQAFQVKCRGLRSARRITQQRAKMEIFLSFSPAVGHFLGNYIPDYPKW